jgi:transposase
VIDPPTACAAAAIACASSAKTGPELWRRCRASGKWSRRCGSLAARDCEKISQAPEPFHAVARGWTGPSLLAMIMFEKYGQTSVHRQAERQALEAVPITLSTMAGAVCIVKPCGERFGDR